MQTARCRASTAAPAWRAGDSAGSHESILQLFGEAEAFRLAAGRRLMQSNGVALSFVTDALPKATASAQPFDMDLIFEATAAASYLSVGLHDSAAHLIVVDMGADDFVECRFGDEAKRLREEAEALLKQYRAKTAGAQQEAQAIIEAAKISAERMAADARVQLQQQLERRA